MDKIGLIAIIVGIILCALGGFAIVTFLPEVIFVIKGLVGIAILLAGILLVIFGALIFRD